MYLASAGLLHQLHAVKGSVKQTNNQRKKNIEKVYKKKHFGTAKSELKEETNKHIWSSD